MADDGRQPRGERPNGSGSGRAAPRATAREPSAAPGEVAASDLLDGAPVGSAHMTLLAVAALTALFYGYVVQALAFTAPVMAASWSVPSTAFALAFSATLVGMVVGSLLFGSLADRWGKQRVLVLCGLLLGASTLLLVAAAGSSTPLLLFRIFLAGGAWIAGQAGMLVLISSAYPSTVRSFAVGTTLAAGRIGLIVSPAVVAIPLAAGWDTIRILLLPVVPALIAALCVWRVRPPEERREPSQSTISITHARTDSR